MTYDNSNRYRVSTKFTMVKVFVFIGFFSILFNLLRDLYNDRFTQKSVTGLALGTLALTGMLYFVSTRKRMDYDDIKQILFVVDKNKVTEIEIPVDKIDEILYSVFGGQGNKSYIIIYRDFYNQRQKVRLFPIPFDDSINTIITDAELKNPNLIIRKWSFGWNELFD